MENKLFRALALVSALAFCLSCGPAEDRASLPSSSVVEDIDRLIRVTGYEQMLPAMLDQMVAPLKSINPQVPEEVWDELIAQFDASEMIDLMVPVYQKHFTHDEIRQLLEFYSTPLGRKIIAVLPAVTQECIAIGQDYGLRAAQRVIQRLQDRGYEIRQGSA